MTNRKSFFLGPLATPVVALALIIFFCIAAGFQVGTGMVRVILMIVAALSAWSYVFTCIVGLPLQLASRRQGWSGWLYLNAAAAVSTLLVALLMFAFGQTGERLWILLPILFFGLCNANFTWFLRRPPKASAA